MDKGFTKIPNYLLRELFETDMNNSCMKVFLFIYRMTAGYQKKEDSLSLSRISAETNLSKSSVVRSLSTLETRKFIKITRRKKQGEFYETNKIKLLKGSVTDDTRGSVTDAISSVSSMTQYQIKGKATPFSIGRVDAPISREKEKTVEEVYAELGDEYE